MNKLQLQEILNYLDAEYAGIVSRMNETERKLRAQHWANEIGSYDFDIVMTAVRKLAQGNYMPRASAVLAEVEAQQEANQKRGKRCRIIRDSSGTEILDLRYSDGSQFMTGNLENFPEWMQIKFRWMADPTPENTARWDEYILHCERERGTLMTVEA